MPVELIKGIPKYLRSLYTQYNRISPLANRLELGLKIDNRLKTLLID